MKHPISSPFLYWIEQLLWHFQRARWRATNALWASEAKEQCVRMRLEFWCEVQIVHKSRMKKNIITQWGNIAFTKMSKANEPISHMFHQQFCHWLGFTINFLSTTSNTLPPFMIWLPILPYPCVDSLCDYVALGGTFPINWDPTNMAYNFLMDNQHG
jgi:hypothetical protein